MDKDKIRWELQNGFTIEQVCNHHNITFTELVEAMQYHKQTGIKHTKRPKKCKYIRKNKGSGHYYIVRSTVNYGTYETLGDAVKVRDWLVSNGWNREQLDVGCEECNVVRCKSGGARR